MLAQRADSGVISGPFRSGRLRRGFGLGLGLGLTAFFPMVRMLYQFNVLMDLAPHSSATGGR